MEISTSILNAEDRVKTIMELNNSATDYIHFDVMDGIFVNNYQFPIAELVDLLKKSTKKNDVHLMINDPIPYIDAIKDLNVEYITIHIEIPQDIKKIINYIKKSNIKCGLAVDINTDIKEINKYIDEVDLILIMSVKAGYGGQVFNKKVLSKISAIPKKVKIEVDGGIDNTNISLIDSDIVVSGSYILKNIKINIENLKKVL